MYNSDKQIPRQNVAIYNGGGDGARLKLWGSKNLNNNNSFKSVNSQRQVNVFF